MFCPELFPPLVPAGGILYPFRGEVRSPPVMLPTKSEKVSSICSECGASVTFDLGSMQVRCDHCEAGLVVEL